MKKVLSIILVFTMILSLFVGCDKQNDGQAINKDIVTIVGRYKCDTVDPASGATGDQAVLHALYDGLIRRDENGDFIPALAERWEESEDGMSVTYYLRKDVKFHDGTAFSADDVIYSLDTMLAIPMYGTFKSQIASWEKIDDYTVKITKGAPYQDINAPLSLAFMIMPKETRSKDPDAFAKAPVGTGAYKFVSIDIDGTVTMVANEEYFGEKAQIKNAIVKPPLDASTSVVALENGEVDLVPDIPPAQLPIIEKSDKLKLSTYDGASLRMLFAMGDYLNSDVNLRKAILHGMNPENIIAIAEEGIGKPVKDILPESMLKENSGVAGFEGYNEQLAKDYLSKSNYDGRELQINIQSSDAALAQAIQADLKKIGINTKIDQLDGNAWGAKIMNGEGEIVPVTTGVIGAVAEDLLFWGSRQHPYFGAFMGGNDEYDALITQILSETNKEKRQELTKEALIMLNDLCIILPLYENVSNFAYSKDITGISPIRSATSVYYINEIKVNK